MRVRHRPAVFLGNIPQNPQPLHQQAVDSDPILESHGDLGAVVLYPCGIRAVSTSKEKEGCGSVIRKPAAGRRGGARIDSKIASNPLGPSIFIVSFVTQ